MMARLLYTLLLYLLLPRVLWHLLWRARKQPAYLKNIPQRFGFYRGKDKDKTRDKTRDKVRQPLIWVHAVSVGETRAAAPLIHALKKKYPGHQILLTHMTPTGSETAEALFGEGVLRCYLPYDYPGAVARFLEHFQPQAGLLMETEIWANLIHACRQRGMPLYLVNARLSQKSYLKYSRFASLARASLRGLAAIAAQTTEDAQRLMALGAEKVEVTGNLKFDVEPPVEQIELGKTWRSSLYGGVRPVLLAASTRDGEEELLLDGLAQAEPSMLTFIVPRHPQRFAAVAAMLENRSIRYQRRSAGGGIAAQTQVVLGDSMGEMFAYYAACDIAFIGGSLLPFGGQNLIEACAAGKPVLIGPHTYNFSEAAELAVACGAALRVDDAEKLVKEAQRLFGNPQLLARMAGAALDFARRHRGATARTLELLHFE